jgi:hypothetical protein
MKSLWSKMWVKVGLLVLGLPTSLALAQDGLSLLDESSRLESAAPEGGQGAIDFLTSTSLGLG